jgi:hypothetical protein
MYNKELIWDNNISCVNFLNHLETKSKWLKEKIEHWQKIILKSDNDHTDKIWDRNISSWYWFNNVSYHSNKLRSHSWKDKLIQAFHNDPYYIFKNMVEIMWRDLVSKHLRKTLWEKLTFNDSRLQVLTTSDSDDVFWWVDLIVKLEYDGNIEYMWIDIAVCWNKKTLEDKINKNEETKCIEYNLFEWNNPSMKIPRKVLQFSPKIMAEMLSQYLKAIENWEYIDTLELYKTIKNQNIVDARDETNFKINNLMRI